MYVCLYVQDVIAKLLLLYTRMYLHIHTNTHSPRADVYKCHLFWESPQLLLIGWGDFIKIAQVKERPARERHFTTVVCVCVCVCI